MPFGEFTESRQVQKAGAPLRPGAGTGSVSMGAGAGGAVETIEGLVEAVNTSVGTDYFKTIGLKVTRGREFTAAEEFSASEDRVAIIDETLAERLFGTGDPIGQIVQWQQGRRGADRTVVARVVGVVAPSRHQLLEQDMRPHLFTTLGQDPRAALFLHAATSAPTAEAESAMLPAVRRELVAIDSELPIIALETRPMYRDRNLVLWVLRAGANIFVAFGLLALFMTVVGVYGVKSYVVARRTREIGIRVALGAAPRDVVGMIVREGYVTTAIGLGGGLLLSVAAGSAIRSLLVGDGAFDAPVILGAAVVLTVAATVAAWIPARTGDTSRADARAQKRVGAVGGASPPGGRRADAIYDSW